MAGAWPVRRTTLRSSGRHGSTSARTAARGVGVFFAACAAGNAVGTMPRAAETIEWFRDSAWLPPYRVLLDRLVPVARPVVGATVAFEAVVAALLFSGRHQRTGLSLATVWVVGVSPAVAYPYWLVNLPQAVLYAGLAARVRAPDEKRR